MLPIEVIGQACDQGRLGDDDLSDPPMTRADLTWLVLAICGPWFAALVVVQALIGESL
jgi:hypothetical protein